MEVISGIINCDMHLCSWRMVCLIREEARMNKCAVYSLSMCVFFKLMLYSSLVFALTDSKDPVGRTLDA